MCLVSFGCLGVDDENKLGSVEDPIVEDQGLLPFTPSSGLYLSKRWNRHLKKWNANINSLMDVVDQLSRHGELLGPGNTPITGYTINGFRWNYDDMTTDEWTPQGMTAGTLQDGRRVVIVAWGHNEDSGKKGVRVSIVDVTHVATVDPATNSRHVEYEHVLLIEPTSSSGAFEAIDVHGGGLAWVGHYLYVADTNRGIRVFDLRRIRTADESCKKIGKKHGKICADGNKYIVPQAVSYFMPKLAREETYLPRFSFLGFDTRAPVAILSGEYCRYYKDQHAYDDAGGAYTCDHGEKSGPNSGSGGRLYRWQIDSDSLLHEKHNGDVKPEKAYFMQEPNVQGVAPVIGTNDSYWLSSTRMHGSLYNVSTQGLFKKYRFDTDHNWVAMSEGISSTAFDNELWAVTEGHPKEPDLSVNGRVVIYVNPVELPLP
jgi:hypothetical protein